MNGTTTVIPAGNHPTYRIPTRVRVSINTGSVIVTAGTDHGAVVCDSFLDAPGQVNALIDALAAARDEAFR